MKTYLIPAAILMLGAEVARADCHQAKAEADGSITVAAASTDASASADATASTDTAASAETEGSAEAADAIDMSLVDLDAAAKIFQKSCRACHGNKAQGASSYPSLADKEPEYIAEKLEIYRSGTKIGPNSILMIQHAKKLSDADIASLAVYVTSAFD